MEGTLSKKTKGGQWHSRQFKLENSMLTWLKSDNKTYVTVDVSRNSEIKEPKFAAKKFSFDVIVSNDVISLAASGEAEKAAWMAALKLAMGKRDEAEGILQKSGVGRVSKAPAKTVLPSTLKKAAPGGASAPPAAAPAVPAAAAAATTATTPAKPVDTPGLTTSTPAPAAQTTTTPGAATPTVGNIASGLSLAANAKLNAKIGGKIGVTQTLCVVCGQTVYKPEELVVDKAVMHKRCFQCTHCKRQLTMGNFACINSVFYCKVHYFELFATNGGKYDKAFGDAGFKTKATTSYTPGEVLQPGKMAAKTISPPKAAAPKAETPASPVPVAATPASPTAEAKPAPKKLEIKAPQSTKVVEKKEVEVVPKKNMDDLRKLVVLPGMAPPKPKKEEAPPAAIETTSEVMEEKAPSSPKGDLPAATESAAPADAAAETPAEVEEGKPQEAAEPAETPEEVTAPAAAPAAASDAPEEEAPIQIVRPPAGVNFALEAMKIRQAQLSKQGIVSPMPEETSEEPTNVRSSVRMSGRLDHSAALSKPRMGGGRRAPKVQEVGKLLPKTEVDRMTHDWTFRVLVAGPSTKDVLVVHATSQFERDHWVATLSANVYMLGLKHELEMAQKRDMMSALQAQVNLENFMNDNKVIYCGFLEKVSLKSQRNWKKRWFDLNQKGELAYFENENSKKAKGTLQLSYLTVIASADGTRLDAPLIINTGATEMSTETDGALPQNIAIFDNEDVTIDLNTIFPDESAATAESAAGGSTALGGGEEDFVVVDKKEAAPAITEMPIPGENESSPVAASEEAPKVEKKASKVDSMKDPESAVGDSDESKEAKINTAWATPGKEPDRATAEVPLKAEDGSPVAAGGSSRRKSGGQQKKPCVIM